MSDVANTPEKSQLVEKPAAALADERRIRDDLIAQGVDSEVAEAVIGYRLADAPFIYRGTPHEVRHHRVRPDWTEGYTLDLGLSDLWVATTAPIHELGGDNADQLSEVIAQWRGSFVYNDPAGWGIERLEARQIGDGRFVEATYGDVSAMGALDGTLRRMALHVPIEQFRPYGTGAPRMQYRIYDFRRDGDGIWTLQTTSNTTGTTILNGYSELLGFHMGEITPVKQDRAYAQIASADQRAISGGVAAEVATAPEAEPQLAAEAEALVTAMLPDVISLLAQAQSLHTLINMVTDGVLRHPDKVNVLGVKLDQFSREKRFELAQHMARIIKDGQVQLWAQLLQRSEGEAHIQAIIRRCTNSFIEWLTRPRHAGMALEWVRNAQAAVDLRRQGVDVQSRTQSVRVGPGAAMRQNPDWSPAFDLVFSGLELACLEQLIEYVGANWSQEYDQRALPPAK